MPDGCGCSISCHANSFIQESDLGRALRNKPVTVVAGEGQCRTLFVHAGMQLGMLNQLELHMPVENVSGEELLGFLNDEVFGMNLHCVPLGQR
jgi:hypothetical protein